MELVKKQDRALELSDKDLERVSGGDKTVVTCTKGTAHTQTSKDGKTVTIRCF